jgi:hypothetical protein
VIGDGEPPPDRPRRDPAGDAVPAADRWLSDLRELGEELRATFAEERRAIGALDHAQLTYLAVHKQHLAERLAEARDTAPAVASPVLRQLFTALRAEAHANALLATVATEAVRALLGYEPAGTYTRSARPTSTHPFRNALGTY